MYDNLYVLRYENLPLILNTFIFILPFPIFCYAQSIFSEQNFQRKKIEVCLT